MASALKRKRGTGEGKEASQKSKAFSNSHDPAVAQLLDHGAGWEAAFNPSAKSKEVVQTNGINGDGIKSPRSSASLEAEDFEGFLEEATRELAEEERLKPVAEKEKKDALLKRYIYDWKLSESIGGRMIDVDPVFTQDERYLIVANRTTIHVYSTSNSLLTRSIKLEIDYTTRPNAHIITYCLSPTNPNLVWVACSDGAIYSIDWTTGAGVDQYWGISSTGCIHMTAASMKSGGRRRDVVFTTEATKDGGWRITANELAPPKGPIQTVARTIYTSDQRIQFLKSGKEGSVIVAASGKRILLGSLRTADYNTIDKIRYEFRVFESSDVISSLDLQVTDRPKAPSEKTKRLPIVNVVVGEVRGFIFVHNDLLYNLVRTQRNPTGESGASLTPRKLHWHRQAVHTVKWSLDGNYIISGGAETVLVLWQLDTGRQQFLPHMSTTIQNVVVSPSGSSYGVQLADNSTMVLSVAELQPTANIVGIQARVLDYEDSIDSSVWRVEEDAFEPPLLQHTAAVVNPANPSQLLLSVGSVQGVDYNKPLITSIPYLQTFDLGSGHGVSRQALTRTNITNTNISPNAHLVSEPRVIHMQTSFNGMWLATVDEWIPSQRDLDFIGHQGSDLEAERRLRREVFLKFWQWSKEDGTWELVTRIDSPHESTDVLGAGRVLDLAADPSSQRFSTIGDDGVLRTWTIRTRKRDGVPVRYKDGNILRNWNCQHAVSIGKSDLLHENVKPLLNASVAFSEDGSVLAAACGQQNEGLVHLLDPHLGTTRRSLTSMFEGPILKMEFLGQDLIIVSDKLLVYDLVVDDVRRGVRFGPTVTALSIQQKVEMIHLAVDRRSHTFAIVLPAKHESPVSIEQSLVNQYSEIAVFQQDQVKPALVQSLPSLVTAILAAVGSDGYLVLDSAAEIRTVLKQGTQVVTSLAQSTSALQLDTTEETTGDLLRLVENEDEVEEVAEAQPPAEMSDDDDEFPVVTQQQLSEIFDIGPSFALPPMEDMFYQVAGLFSSKVAA